MKPIYPETISDEIVDFERSSSFSCSTPLSVLCPTNFTYFKYNCWSKISNQTVNYDQAVESCWLLNATLPSRDQMLEIEKWENYNNRPNSVWLDQIELNRTTDVNGSESFGQQCDFIKLYETNSRGERDECNIARSYSCIYKLDDIIPPAQIVFVDIQDIDKRSLAGIDLNNQMNESIFEAKKSNPISNKGNHIHNDIMYRLGLFLRVICDII